MEELKAVEVLYKVFNAKLHLWGWRRFKICLNGCLCRMKTIIITFNYEFNLTFSPNPRVYMNFNLSISLTCVLCDKSKFQKQDKHLICYIALEDFCRNFAAVMCSEKTLNSYFIIGIILLICMILKHRVRF